MVGTAVGGLIGWSGPPPPADPDTVRALLIDLGLRHDANDEEVVAALRAFQARTGLRPDGIAGPRTVHFLSRYATEALAWNENLAA